jgi:CRP/FNR family transcriptional regulator, cyclic AMP receptor protein
MTHPTPQELLGAPLFAALDAEAAAVLAGRFDIEHFDTGRRVVLEGSSGYAFYVLAEGQAAVSHEGEQLRTLAPGDFFGEIAILGEGRRTATVTATEPVTAWKMFGTAFREMEKARPDVAPGLQHAMRQRLTNG